MSDESGRSRDGLEPADTDTERTVGLRGLLASALAALALLGAGIWLSTLARPGPLLHDVALFIHLGFLVLGFGAVLVADYVFALWALGRTTLAEAVANTARLHLLIWSGLAGLVVSGALLGPDLSSATTVLKLVLVAALTLNGVQAMALERRMRAYAGVLPPRLLLWGGATAAVSQISWWGAVVIGFLNANR